MTTDLKNFNLSDDQVAEAYIAGFPPAVKLAIGAPMRATIVDAIRRERTRCVDMLAQAIRHHARQKRDIEGNLQAALAAKQEGAAQNLGVMRLQSEAVLASLKSTAQAVALEPGACEACGGAGQVASSIVLAGGGRAALVCQACGGEGRGREKVPAPAAVPQNGVAHP